MFNLLLYAITYISLKLAITDQFIDAHKVFNMYSAMFLIQLIFMSIGIFIAVIMRKPKPASGIASGLVIFTYLLGMFSNITEEMKNLVYISPLHYFLPDKIIRTGEFETKYLAITAGVTIVSLLIAWRVYNKKDFNI
ncbi:MAG: ABC transporter permease, partial [Clostridia bacterium]|nr:ABC transporter permease [Clostridia bacterium]MDD4387502.1 ABC transporter permease [Clostridia bacterium]